jgi:EAL domain-containing protein (putative c-di-GMP-specific phosphodiesterase class I)
MLKLDRTLIQGFERDKERRAMVVATLALARESGLTAVVVGIETNRQLALARELDCSVGQGFLLHRPNAPEGLRLREAPGTIRLPPPWRPIVRLRGTHRH